jgi:hypothetical protein
LRKKRQSPARATPFKLFPKQDNALTASRVVKATAAATSLNTREPMTCKSVFRCKPNLFQRAAMPPVFNFAQSALRAVFDSQFSVPSACRVTIAYHIPGGLARFQPSSVLFQIILTCMDI